MLARRRKKQAPREGTGCRAARLSAPLFFRMLPSETHFPPATPPVLPPRSWLRRRVLDPLFDLLKAGLSPGKLALTVGLGAAIGLIPAFGITTVLSAAVVATSSPRSRASSATMCGRYIGSLRRWPGAGLTVRGSR